MQISWPWLIIASIVYIAYDIVIRKYNDNDLKIPLVARILGCIVCAVLSSFLIADSNANLLMKIMAFILLMFCGGIGASFVYGAWVGLLKSNK